MNAVPVNKPDETGRLTAEEWRAACAKGDCTYPDPLARPVDRVMCAVPPTCPGYTGTVYLEEGREVMRWRRCPRHVAWWKEEQRRISHRKAAIRAPFAKPVDAGRERRDVDG